MYHILIIEDDVEINRLLTEFLEENGYYVVSQYNGLHILDILQENKIDLVLLDIMLPYKSGDSVLADIRKQSTVPVIIILRKEPLRIKLICYGWERMIILLSLLIWKKHLPG